MSKKLIHTEILDSRMVKVFKDSQWGEFICELFELKPKIIAGGHLSLSWVSVPEASYHSCSATAEDREDALATALAMVRPNHA